MYEINREYNSQEVIYTYKTVNSENQKLHLELYATDCNPETVWWCCCFYIASKRKHGYQELQQVGKDGIRSLVWAKNCINDFVQNAFKNPLYLHNNLLIFWDDSKRRKVYTYGLGKLGFKFTKFKGKDCLFLKIT